MSKNPYKFSWLMGGVTLLGVVLINLMLGNVITLFISVGIVGLLFYTSLKVDKQCEEAEKELAKAKQEFENDEW